MLVFARSAGSPPGGAYARANRKEDDLPGYVIADVDVHDPERYPDYTRLVPGTLEPFGGRFVVRGGATEVLEGSWSPSRLVVLEFPSVEHARAWYESDVYREAKALRQRYSTGNLVLVDGVDKPAPPG